MHERRLIADLVAEALRICATQAADRVTCLRLRIGSLSHVTPEVLRAGIEDAATGTPLAGARLLIEQDRDPGWAHAQGVVLVELEVASATPTPD